MKGRLAVVGSGIRAGLQITPEARAEIVAAERVFYIEADPIAIETIHRANPRAESLSDLYGTEKPRSQTYAEMVDRILTAVRAGERVCVVAYGHPGVFADPTHSSIRIARAEGFAATMLPGISAEDCLFADLGIDPAKCGKQSYEATDFLVNRRRHDETSLLVLWQIGAVGFRAAGAEPLCWNPGGLSVLVDTLSERYGKDHEVIVYLAASLPLCKPYVRRSSLATFRTDDVPVLATLVVPPLISRPPDLALRDRLRAMAPRHVA